MSMITTTTDRFRAWAAKDNNTLGWFLEHPIEQSRWHMANAVSQLGAALSRLGHRIERDVPGDFWDGYRDGQQITAFTAAATTATTREDVREWLAIAGIPSDDATLERMGWEATA